MTIGGNSAGAAVYRERAVGIPRAAEPNLRHSLVLLGVAVAALHDQGPLADADIGLAQANAARLGQPHQILAGLVDQLGVGPSAGSG